MDMEYFDGIAINTSPDNTYWRDKAKEENNELCIDHVIIPMQNFKTKIAPGARILYGVLYTACEGGACMKQLKIKSIAKELNTTKSSTWDNLKKLEKLKLIKIHSGQLAGEPNTYEII